MLTRPAKKHGFGRPFASPEFVISDMNVVVTAINTLSYSLPPHTHTVSGYTYITKIITLFIVHTLT